MTKRRVPIFKTSPVKSVLIDPEATEGAQVGVNLIGPDGKLVSRDTWKRLLAGGGQADTGSSGGTTDGIEEGAYNLYFTNERAQDAVGGILKDSANVTLTYDDAGPGIKADLTDVTLTTGGDLKRYGFDAKGRLSESDDAVLSDLSDVADTAATDGQVLTRESGAWVPKDAQGGSGGVPYLILEGGTFTVPERIQDLFATDIIIQGSGDLNVEGMLINVGGG